MSTESAPFDELDRKIVAALIENGRASYAEIGTAIGLSPTAVKRRVDRLRENDVITGFSATVRPAALGWLTEAYVEVYCDSAAPPRRLAEVVRNHPEIAAAMTVTGGADALLHVRAADVGHFEEVLERIRTEPFIRKTISYMVLSHLLPDSPEAGARLPSDAPDDRTAGRPAGRSSGRTAVAAADRHRDRPQPPGPRRTAQQTSAGRPR